MIDKLTQLFHMSMGYTISILLAAIPFVIILIVVLEVLKHYGITGG